MYYILLSVAAFWPLLARAASPKTFSWQEVLLQITSMLVIVFLGWQVGTYAAASRTEIWNGEITAKSSDWVSCDHSYSCNCRTITDKDGRKSEVCDTCYEHNHDIDWNVQTNVGNFQIPRIDRQGVLAPPRWTRVEKGQPAAREHAYQNYVAAQKSSLFHKQLEDMADLPDVPPYPRVYDYHYADRVLPVGTTLPELKLWQSDLAAALKTLGPGKQANVTLIVANTPSQQYRYKVEAAWQGANKNDVIVIVGVTPEDLKILWADVITFADNIGNEELRINLRNALLDLGMVERTKILPLVTRYVNEYYKRPEMSSFDYLRGSIEPSLIFKVIFTFLFLLTTGGLTWFFHHNDVELFRRRTI